MVNNLSTTIRQANGTLVFDVVKDGENQCRIERGLAVADVGDDVVVFIGKGDMTMIYKAIEALTSFVVRKGHGEDLRRFVKDELK